MDSVEIKKVAKTSDFDLVLYDIYDEFTKKKTGTEFCLVPFEMYYDYVDHNFWSRVMNCVLSCLIFKLDDENGIKSIKGVSDTATAIDFKMLNKRYIEPGKNYPQAGNIFNYLYRYAHGTVKINEMIINHDNEFIKLDVVFTFSSDGKNIGNIRYQIYAFN